MVTNRSYDLVECGCERMCMDMDPRVYDGFDFRIVIIVGATVVIHGCIHILES